MTDIILSVVDHLVREDGPFVSALTQTRDTSRAIERALETIETDIQRTLQAGKGGIRRLEALFRARLLEGLKRDELTADSDVDDLSTFYANIVVSLVVEALSGGQPERLAAIRRVAVRILLQKKAVLT